MTTEPPTSEGRGPHLDDDALSAALDGEASTAGAGHLDLCADCRSRVENLRAVQALVAAPPPVDPARREQALAAAVAAFEPVEPRHAGGELVEASRHTSRRRRRSVDLAPWVGVAALVLLVALAVPLLAGRGGEDDDAGEAATTAGDVAAGSGGSEESAAAAAPAPAVDVGDLGVLAAGADLRPVVDRALGPPQELDGTGPSADAGGGGQEESEQGAGGDATDDGAPTTTSRPRASGGGTDAAAPDPGAGTDGPAVCEAAVRAQLPDAGALLLTGTATVDDAPAVVHGFAAPTQRPTVLVALVAVEGCRIVTFQSYGRG